MFRHFSMLLPSLLVTGMTFAQRPDTVVRMAGAPRYAGVATLAEELSIGAESGPEEYTFGSVFDIAVAPNGAVYILDRSLGAVRVFDASGKYVRTQAGRGQGPGEIQSPSGMRVLPDGRLAIYDSQNKRVNIYAENGTNLTPFQLSSGGGTIVHRNGFASDTAGFLYVKRTVVTVPPGNQRTVLASTVWLRLRGSGGVVVDSIAEPSWPTYPEPFRATAPNGWRQIAVPFTPARLMVVSPLGYAVTGLPDRYAFELLMPEGAVISVRRDTVPAQLTAQERGEARNRIETQMREVDPRWSWGGRDVPRARPLYEEIAVGLDGRIWIARNKPTLPPTRPPANTGRVGGSASSSSASSDEPFVYRPTMYDVFEPGGAFIGRVQAPPRVSLMVMRGEHAWGVARDENDVEFVKRFRILWK